MRDWSSPPIAATTPSRWPTAKRSSACRRAARCRSHAATGSASPAWPAAAPSSPSLRARACFYRSDAFREKLIAANVTQIVGVVAPGLGLDEELINRWMIAAESQGCRFVLAANKSDLPQYAELLQRLAPFAALGYAVVELSALRDAAPLNTWLAGNHTVLVGQSGMGKSTIVNSLIPSAAIRSQRGLRGAGHRAPHDYRDDAIPAAGAGRGHMDRRFARDEGVRTRASRPRSHCGGFRRTASAAGALPLSRLPSRCRARMRDPGGGLRGTGREASDCAAARR